MSLDHDPPVRQGLAGTPCACGAYAYQRGNMRTIQHNTGCPVLAEELAADAADQAERDAEAAVDALREEAP